MLKAFDVYCQPERFFQFIMPGFENNCDFFLNLIILVSLWYWVPIVSTIGMEIGSCNLLLFLNEIK